MPEQIGTPASRLSEARKQIRIALADIDGEQDVDGMDVDHHLGTALEHLRRVEHALEEGEDA